MHALLQDRDGGGEHLDVQLRHEKLQDDRQALEREERRERDELAPRYHLSPAYEVRQAQDGVDEGHHIDDPKARRPGGARGTDREDRVRPGV